MNNNDLLPWIEKYRPQQISDVICHDNNILVIKKLLAASALPHILFYGPSGTGKTSIIMSIINELYGINSKLMVMKLDASDERGINLVRDEIKSFVNKTNMFCKGTKMVILDEADAMTFDAQFALRRIIEKYSSTVRFCIICNYINKIIPAIRSRFANFRFNLINNIDIKKKLLDIINIEQININHEFIDIICNIVNGDLRKAINIIHTLSFYENISKNDLYTILNIINPIDIEYILKILYDTTKSYNQKYIILYDIINNKQYNLQVIIHDLFNSIINNNILCQPYIIINLGELENKIIKIMYNNIYISALINIFRYQTDFSDIASSSIFNDG